MKLRCVNDARAQGSITKGMDYEWTGRIKTGKFDIEIEVLDNKGSKKWFVYNRFDTSPIATDIAAHRSRMTPLDKKEEIKMVPTDKMPKDVLETAKKIGDKMGEVLKKYPTYTPIPAREMELLDDFGDVFKKGLSVMQFAQLKSGDKTYAAIVDLEAHALVGLSEEYLKAITTTSKTVEFAKIPFEVKMAEPVEKSDVKKEEPLKATTTKAESKGESKMTLREFLAGQGVPAGLINDLSAWRKEHTVDESMKGRVPKISQLFLGGATWTVAIAALLKGHNILLEGAKATGKNTLAENLAYAFGRPMWDASFHSAISASQLVGSETFKGGQVVFNPGIIHNVGKFGGFGVLDEINMAKNENVAVLHSATDGRRLLDVPGYDVLHFDDATRFIGTMNYGYAGTRELNEALVSRFDVISVPEMTPTELINLITMKFPTLVKSMAPHFVGIFTDLQTKAKNTEISTKAVDLRGIIGALQLIQVGISPKKALEVGIVNKAFEPSERQIIRDVINTRVKDAWTPSLIFNEPSKATSGLDVDFSKVR